MNTLIVPVTPAAMQTLQRFGAGPVPGRPGFASVPIGVVDLMFAPLTGLTEAISFAITPE